MPTTAPTDPAAASRVWAEVGDRLEAFDRAWEASGPPDPAAVDAAAGGAEGVGAPRGRGPDARPAGPPARRPGVRPAGAGRPPAPARLHDVPARRVAR